MKKELILGIDVDGVLRDFITSLYKVFLSEYPEYRNTLLLPENHNDYALENIFPIGSKIYDFLYNKFPKDIFYEEATPYKGIIEMMESLYNAGHQIEILSANNKNGFVKEWLDYYEIPFHQIILFQDKLKKYILHCDCYLDDNLEVVKSIISNKPNSLVFLQDRPWNQTNSLPPGIFRVFGPDNFYNIVSIVSSCLSVKEDTE